MPLIFPCVSVECRQVQVRRRLGNVKIAMIGLEKVVNDQRRPVEEYAGHFIWVWDKRVAAHDAIKYQARVRQSPHGEGRGRYRASVRRVGRSQMRIHDVLRVH